MAVVTEGYRARRGSVYDNALRLLATVDVAALCRARPGGRWRGLTEAASVLAAIRLDDVTVERTGREIGMPITLEGTIGGRSLEKRLEKRLSEKITEEVRAEVTEEVRAMLATLLRRTFGDDPRIPQAAARLADLGPAVAVERALTTTSLDALLADG